MAEHRYWPSLDGVRGVAIAAVVAYHLGYLGGGWDGVDVFFVLSGFLITSLLLSEQAATGRIRLRAFWARRARRLLPALLFLLVALAVYTLAGGPGAWCPPSCAPPPWRRSCTSPTGNRVAAGHDYFAQFQAVNPLMHTWSLAVEEQYYLVWPLLVAALVGLGRRRSLRALVVGDGRRWRWHRRCGWVSPRTSSGPDRAYLGTDTRVWELLLGGLGAMALRRAGPGASPGVVERGDGARRVRRGTGHRRGPGPSRLDVGRRARRHRAGRLVVVVGSVRHPDGPVARLLAIGPLRWLGRISYSLYLWHWPVIVLLTHAEHRIVGCGAPRRAPRHHDGRAPA